MSRKDSIVNILLIVLGVVLIFVGVAVMSLSPLWFMTAMGIMAIGVFMLFGGVILILLPSDGKAKATIET